MVKRITGTKDLLEYINEVKFALYVGVKDVKLTNLWDETENPSWDMTLGPWLDEIIKDKSAVYPLILKNRTGIVSKDFFPYFYRIKSEEFDLINFTIDDYYMKGVLSQEAKSILEALETRPRGVSELRKISNTCGKEGKSAFDKAMLDLKKKFAIVKVDLNDVGWGKNVFSLTHLEFPEETEAALALDEVECYEKIIYKYLELYQEVNDLEFARIFGFDKKRVKEIFTGLSDKLSVREEGKKIIYGVL